MDVDPLTALLTLFAFNKYTGCQLTDQQIHDGDLKNLLLPEDFSNTEKVLTLYHSLAIHRVQMSSDVKALTNVICS